MAKRASTDGTGRQDDTAAGSEPVDLLQGPESGIDIRPNAELPGGDRRSQLEVRRARRDALRDALQRPVIRNFVTGLAITGLGTRDDGSGMVPGTSMSVAGFRLMLAELRNRSDDTASAENRFASRLLSVLTGGEPGTPAFEGVNLSRLGTVINVLTRFVPADRAARVHEDRRASGLTIATLDPANTSGRQARSRPRRSGAQRTTESP